MKTKKLLVALLIEFGCAIVASIIIQMYTVSRVFTAVSGKQSLQIHGSLNSALAPIFVPLGIVLYVLNIVAFITFIVYLIKIFKVKKATHQKFFEVVDSTPKFQTILNSIFIFWMVDIGINVLIGIIQASIVFR